MNRVRTIAIIGDSLAALRKSNSDEIKIWPELLREEAHEFSIKNISKPYADSRLLDKLKSSTSMSDIIILQLGIVDCAPRRFRKIEQRVLSLFSSRPRGVIIDFLHRLPSSKRAYVKPQKYFLSMHKFCERHNTKKIVIIPIMPPSKELLNRNPYISKDIRLYNDLSRAVSEYFTNTSYIDVSGFQDSSLFLDDGYHLNKEGHKLLASLVKLAIDL